MTEHRIYTGSFATWDRVRPDEVMAVRISVGIPKTITGAAGMPICSSLIPTGLLNPPISRDHFERAYRARLANMGAARIERELASLHRRAGKSLLLLDWDRLSHGPVFADWWLEHTGEFVPEYRWLPVLDTPREPRQLQLV